MTTTQVVRDILMGDNPITGHYLTLEVVSGSRLRVGLTEEGLQWLEDKGDVLGDPLDHLETHFWETMDDIAGNSAWRYHADIGNEGFGLTNAPGFIYGHRNDEGKYTKDALVWWFPSYEAKTFIEDLANSGVTYFDLQPSS